MLKDAQRLAKLVHQRSQTLGEQSDGYGMLLPASKRHTAIMVCVTGWVFS